MREEREGKSDCECKSDTIKMVFSDTGYKQCVNTVSQ